MARPGDPRVGQVWMDLIAWCKDNYPWICHLCDEVIPVDITDNAHPLAYQVDHVLTVEAYPHLALRRDNLRPSHRQCNRMRGSKDLNDTLREQIKMKYGYVERPALALFDRIDPFREDA